MMTFDIIQCNLTILKGYKIRTNSIFCFKCKKKRIILVIFDIFKLPFCSQNDFFQQPFKKFKSKKTLI